MAAGARPLKSNSGSVARCAAVLPVTRAGTVPRTVPMTTAVGEYAKAVALAQAGRLDEAATVARRILAATPQNAAALDLLGMIARQQGDTAAALDRFTEAVVRTPDSPSIRLHRGLALRAVGGRDEEAVREFERAVALQPDLAEAHHQLGNAWKALHRYGEAARSLLEATRLAPDAAPAWLNLGVTQLELRRRTEAVASFTRAIQLEPGRPEAHNILGAALLRLGETTAAREALTEALRLRPNYADAHNNMALALKAQGRLPESILEFRTALAEAPNPGTHSNLVYALNFDPTITPDVVFAEHRAWDQIYAAPLARAIAPHPNDASPTRRLRVGFVSADFMDHAVAYFFEPFLSARNRQMFEVFCYSDVRVADRVTQRLRALTDRWRDTATLSQAQLVEAIRADGIDILVDLAGHTAENRLLVFARKPAPVQVTWLGYPNTTGLTAIDYRITDAISDPPGETDRWHSEELIRLPTPFLCYQPPEESPNVAAPPDGAAVTFGSFSNLPKLSEPCLAAWARVLQRMADSRLVLKSRGLGDRETIARLHQFFASYGIAADRIELIGQLAPVAEHLALYHRIDIALDPFPYHGTTSTCEALWMGLPVVTLAGRTHVQRVGVSLLTAIGATEWLATSIDEYVDRSVALAASVKSLRSARAEFRERVRRGPLCDAAGFAVKMEAAFRAVWERYCAERA